MELPANALLDPLRRGPAIWFQQMDTPRPHRNRIHLDVDVAPELAQSRIDGAGGGRHPVRRQRGTGMSRVTRPRLPASPAPPSPPRRPDWWVLADPEGNEACVCTWQGRD
ncbi:MAG: 4a-hydroxytetrahydrobiopterin dehydratase [Mycobacterium sp.]|nr:4a-hydroxytetrahydrobiopterin dehydratase [Mycobacterium sp.]